MSWPDLIIVLVCFLVCILGASVYAAAPRRAPAREAHGGVDFAKSPHLVIDTLNLTHWLCERRDGGRPPALTPALIAEAIDETAAALRRRHTGRVMYVLKDRESQFNDAGARDIYRRAAERNKVYVSAAERYVDPPASAPANDPAAHSSRGRDDFYMSLLANRHRCAVLTDDRLRDFAEFRTTVPPFHVVEYAFWRDQPLREFIRPEAPAYIRMRRPRMVRPADYFDED